jgi:dTDP-4-dehydrorhamnose reductase
MDSIIATGADGLIGSRLTELYPDELQIDNLSLATGVDITNAEQIEELLAANKAPVLIHFAAYTDAGAAAKEVGDESGLCYQVNVIGTKNIAEACTRHGKHLIHISTDFVFDGQKETAYTEEDEPNPIDWYGKTKYLAEQEVERAGGSYTIVRLSYPYRAQFKGKQDYVAKVRQALDDGTIRPQFADTLFTPTFVDDIAHGLRLLIDRRPTGIYHLTGSKAYSNYDAAVIIARAFHLDESKITRGSLEEYLKTPDARRFQRRLEISPVKFEREFDYNMANLEEGLIEIIEQNGEQLKGLE